MNKKAIVSFASMGRENYNKAQLRLIKSCVDCGWDGDYYIRSYDGYVPRYEGVDIILGSYPVTERYGMSYNHAETPFQFKPYIVLEAIERGYEQIIWCDSTIVMQKDIQPLLDYAKKNGICGFHNLGHNLGNWLTDMQQERLGFTNEELIAGIPQLMACVLIFDMTHPIGLKIFEDWLTASRDGVSFQNGYGSQRPGFVATRHDQSFISGLCHINGVKFLPYGKLCYQPHDVTHEYGSDIYFVNKAVD